MHPFEVDDLFNLVRLSDLKGGPSSPHVVFATAQAIRDGDCYRTQLWHLDLDAGSAPRSLTSDAFDASSPVVDPDVSRVAFLSTRLGDAPQVHVLPLAGGEARQLSRSQRQLQTIEQWSGDGQRLLATAQVAWAEDAQDDPDADGRPVVVNFLPWKLDGSGPRAGFRTVLLEIDADSGEERVLVEGDFDVMEAAWSPDGTRLAFIRGRGGLQRHGLDLWLADADGTNARQATHTLASLAGLAWSPDGACIVFGGSEEEGDSISRPWRFDIEGDRLRCLDDQMQLEGSHIAWHPDGRRFATIAARRGLQEVRVVDADTGKSRRVDDGLQQATSLCVAGDRLVFVAARMDRPDEVQTVGWDGGSADDGDGGASGDGGDVRDGPSAQGDELSSFNTWFTDRALPRAEKRGFQVPDGEGGTEEVEGWVLLPPQGDGPFPLLVDLHGGPQSHVLIDFASHAYWYPLLSRGWAILAPNVVGSGSYGRDFARRLRGRWGELDLPQVMAMIDALQEEGIAGERLACTGKSYGGYLAAWAIGQTSRFQAAVVSAPISDIESHTGTSDTGYYVNPYSMEGEIDEVRERYHRLSPIEYCQTVRTSTLVLQGDEDQRCPLGQAEELYANLVRCAEVPARMVVYPGGSHMLASNGRPTHRVDYHTRLVDWVLGER